MMMMGNSIFFIYGYANWKQSQYNECPGCFVDALYSITFIKLNIPVSHPQLYKCSRCSAVNSQKAHKIAKRHAVHNRTSQPLAYHIHSDRSAVINAPLCPFWTKGITCHLNVNRCSFAVHIVYYNTHLPVLSVNNGRFVIDVVLVVIVITRVRV